MGAADAALVRDALRKPKLRGSSAEPARTARRNGTLTNRGMIGNVGLEVIVRDGMIKTAFPVAVP